MIRDGLDNLGGVAELYVREFLPAPLVGTAPWVRVNFTVGTASYSYNDTPSGHGILRANTIRCSVPRFGATRESIINLWNNRSLEVRAVLHNGNDLTFGNLDYPVSIGVSFESGEGAKGSNFYQIIFTFNTYTR
jgi:hypothetical protein